MTLKNLKSVSKRRKAKLLYLRRFKTILKVIYYLNNIDKHYLQWTHDLASYFNQKKGIVSSSSDMNILEIQCNLKKLDNLLIEVNDAFNELFLGYLNSFESFNKYLDDDFFIFCMNYVNTYYNIENDRAILIISEKILLSKIDDILKKYSNTLLELSELYERLYFSCKKNILLRKENNSLKEENNFKCTLYDKSFMISCIFNQDHSLYDIFNIFFFSLNENLQIILK